MTETQLQDLARKINDAYRAGESITIDGRRVKTYGQSPATTWGTGSLSVSVQARSSAAKTDNVWVKPDTRTPVVTFSHTR